MWGGTCGEIKEMVKGGVKQQKESTRGPGTEWPS